MGTFKFIGYVVAATLALVIPPLLFEGSPPEPTFMENVFFLGAVTIIALLMTINDKLEKLNDNQ
jgi:Na+/melibiose symporter-like transporter